MNESRLDSNVPDSQFSLPGYRIVTKDRNKNGGGILFYPHQKHNEKDFLFHLNNIYNLHHIRKYNVDRPFQYVTRKKN